MAKRLISVWLSATILLFSTIAIYADEKVQGQFLNRHININGTTIENYYLEKPLLLHGGFTYLPLNEEMGGLLGFDVEMDWDSNTLKILKKEPQKNDIGSRKLKSNLKDLSGLVVEDVSVITTLELEDDKKASGFLEALLGYPFGKDVDGQAIAFGDAFFRKSNILEEVIDTEVYPLVMFGETIYLPIRAITDESSFGWDVYYDNYSGVYISSDEDTRAISLLDKRESDYNRGLVNYIMDRNREISLGWATTLVFLFKHEAEIYDIDELLLIAMAQRESTFRYDVVGRNGPVGLMQIMPATAAAYGVSREELFDPHKNIEFGAMYIKAKLDQYGNNATVALSAYNLGGRAISRGGYSTRYASNTETVRKGIENYLTNKGFQ